MNEERKIWLTIIIVCLLFILFSLTLIKSECVELNNVSVSWEIKKNDKNLNSICLMKTDFGNCELHRVFEDCEVPSFNSTWATNIFGNLVSPCEPCS